MVTFGSMFFGVMMHVVLRVLSDYFIINTTSSRVRFSKYDKIWPRHKKIFICFVAFKKHAARNLKFQHGDTYLQLHTREQKQTMKSIPL